MIWAEIVWGLIALVLVLDARRIHRRLVALPVLGLEESKEEDTHVWVVAPGIELDDQTRASGEAYRLARGLAAVDVVPGAVSLATAWSYGCHIDPERHRAETDQPGDTAAAAFLAPRRVVEQFGGLDTASDLGTFVSWAREVRRRVDGPHDFVIAPSLRAQGSNPFFDPGALEVKLGGSAAPVAFGVPCAAIVILLGPLLAPWMGTLALCFHVTQQAFALQGTGFNVRYPWLQGLVRIVVDMRQWLYLLSRPAVSRERVDALRSTYMDQIAEGTAHFFDEPMVDCPMCHATDLTRGFFLPDLYQGKPGRFRIVRCRDCDYTFQNPRLNSDGLSFYYRDFYDGIGEDALDMVFGATRELYLDRIELVKKHSAPDRWLDVGCGHGHMFSHVRIALPDTQLVGLDLGDGVDIAEARNWVDEAHKGLFPDLSADLHEQFDMVSMCHYLEHTTDLRTELQAAHHVLRPGGHVLIEVPDPDSVFARLLGRWWMPWFQPQHLNFASTVHMAALLRSVGFEPIEWQTGSAHQPNDFTLSFHNMVRSINPKLDVPWRKAPTTIQRIVHAMIWVPGFVFVACGAILDRLLIPVARRLHHTSQYRVIAQKRSAF